MLERAMGFNRNYLNYIVNVGVQPFRPAVLRAPQRGDNKLLLTLWLPQAAVPGLRGGAHQVPPEAGNIVMEALCEQVSPQCEDHFGHPSRHLRQAASAPVLQECLDDRERKYKSCHVDVRRLHQIKDRVMKMVEDTFNSHEQRLRNIIRAQYKIDPPDTTKLKLAIEEL